MRPRCNGFVVILALCATAVAGGQQSPASRDALVLVTLDGARVEEVFGGLDAKIFRSTLDEDERLEDQPAYERFWAPTPEERRAKLMPFVWGTLLVREGSIAGNPSLGSHVRLANRHRFSYPGYAEILLGFADDTRIASNDPVRNPHVTILEALREELRLERDQVATFASWSVMSAIASHAAGATFVNAGFTPYDGPDEATRRLSALQFETPTPWNSVRHDVYTFRFAMAHLAAARPRVLHLALGETDDWAHDGRYDRVLEAYARSDAYVREIWEWLQADPDYRGRTHLVITTDHGRGRTPKDWRHHGAKVAGAEDVWIALASPRLSQRGEWRDHPPLSTSQIAATVAGWMGVDWRSRQPSAAPPIEPPRPASP